MGRARLWRGGDYQAYLVQLYSHRVFSFLADMHHRQAVEATCMVDGHGHETAHMRRCGGAPPSICVYGRCLEEGTANSLLPTPSDAPSTLDCMALHKADQVESRRVMSSLVRSNPLDGWSRRLVPSIELAPPSCIRELAPPSCIRELAPPSCSQ